MTTRSQSLLASAYGGEGWHPRQQSLRDELGILWASCGINTEWARLEAVLLHRPGSELAVSVDPNAVNMLAAVDLDTAQWEHDALATAYRAAGVTVEYITPGSQPPPNLMFAADLFAMTPEGAILARPASIVRAGEERLMAQTLAAMGMPILRSISGSGTFEGADLMWLDPHAVVIGCGLRTNERGAAQVAAVLAEMGVEALQVDLPFGSMHLMGMLRIVDQDLAIGYPARLPHRAVQALQQRGLQVAWIPDEEEARCGYALNFVTLGPRQILMPAGNPVTQAFYEHLGIECRTVEMGELGKAAGSIGCLSGILRREKVG